tara:strand:+ start:1656 stop:2102 length:447 start_codon:yes stop_codon:yes gene_type:complete
MTDTEIHKMITGMGRKVQAIRRWREITLPQLAVKAKVSKGYLYQLEEGQTTNPSVEILYKLAGALELTIYDLLGEEKLFRVLPSEVPDSLNQFIKKKKREKEPLSKEEVYMLSGINLMGKSPRSPKDWDYIFESIKMRIDLNSRKALK